MTISSRFAATRFPSSVVGSLPRPLMVKDMLPDVPGPESAAAARSPQMDAAVRYAIAVQELAGLDVISDGEWRRHAYTHIVADITTGFTADLRTDRERWGISITEPMEVVKPGLIAEEARFLVDATDRMTKVCIPSPYLLGVRLWEEEVSKKAYPTRNQFIDALVPILREELRLLQGRRRRRPRTRRTRTKLRARRRPLKQRQRRPFSTWPCSLRPTMWLRRRSCRSTARE